MHWVLFDVFTKEVYEEGLDYLLSPRLLERAERAEREVW
jgi:hypothetical protein